CQVLGHCLGLSGDDATAIQVGQRLPMARRLDLITELAHVNLRPSDAARVRDWAAAARKASDRRNSIIHSAWLGDPTTDEFGGALTKRGKHEPQWGRRELQEAIDQLRRAIETPPDLRQRVGA